LDFLNTIAARYADAKQIDDALRKLPETPMIAMADHPGRFFRFGEPFFFYDSGGLAGPDS